MNDGEELDNFMVQEIIASIKGLKQRKVQAQTTSLQKCYKVAESIQ